MKFLITGGAGFIGSHIARKLKEKDPSSEVICYDNLTVGKKDNVPKDCILIKGDILDKNDLLNSLEGVDICIHMAAFVSIRGSFEDNLLAHEAETNINGTLNVMEACAKQNVKKLVNASSMAVYGEPKSLPVNEDMYVKPNSPYGLSKLRGEVYSEIMQKQNKIDVINLRLFNTYGLKQTPSPYVGVITIFINQALKGEPMTIFGDGNQARDFIWVEDVANAFVLAAYSNKTGVYNVGSGKEYTINQIAEMIKKQIPGSEIKYIDAPHGEVSRMVADISKIKKELNFEPQGNLENILPLIIDWWKKQI